MAIKAKDELYHGAEAVWGLGPHGHPSVTLTRMGPMRRESDGPFSFRFLGEEVASSPEDLLAAAHVSCYATSLSSVLINRGLMVERLRLRSVCVMRGDPPPGAGWAVDEVFLEVQVQGALTETELEEARQVADAVCPVSKSLVRPVPVRWRGQVDEGPG